MIQNNLRIILQNYIDQFDRIDQGESYKWAAVQHFQNHWNIEADDFGAMFKNSISETVNMISNSMVQPASGIIELARHESETVREMFRALYTDDGGDWVARQNRIDTFLAQAEALLLKYAPGKWRFKQDARTLITYLNLHNPDENFIYKATEANLFAKYVGQVHDFGSGRYFKLANYYRMCEQLVEAIVAHPELCEINSRRLNETTWPDIRYHILASDIIYCASNYTLFTDIELPKPARKSSGKKVTTVINPDLAANVIEIQSRLDDLQTRKETMTPILLTGITVQHKRFGSGVISVHDKDVMTVRFDGGDKKLGLPDAFILKSITTDVPEIQAYYDQLGSLLDEEQRLRMDLSLAKIELSR